MRDAPNRLDALDAFRGFTIAAMVLVNNPGDWGNLYSQLAHAKWHGWTFTDTIFPFFLFIGGVAMALALFTALVYSDFRGGIMFTTGLALMGMAAGRGYAAWLERPTSPIIWGLLAGEAVLGLMIFFRV